MKLEKQDWQYRWIDEERLAIIEAAPSPLPATIELLNSPCDPLSCSHLADKDDHQMLPGPVGRGVRLIAIGSTCRPIHIRDRHRIFATVSLLTEIDTC